MSNFINLYDRLIEEIPNNLKVSSFMQGVRWTYVEADGNYGLAMTTASDAVTMGDGIIIGKPLKEIAKLSKSWNFYEASIGVAAINCYYNSYQTIKKLGLDLYEDYTSENCFNVPNNQLVNKKVLSVGHFPGSIEELNGICDFTILERNHTEYDLPDSACEYILKDQDYIFITASTLINKTLPRLLELAPPTSKVILVGPSATCSQIFSAYGVDMISGLTITDPQKLKDMVRIGIKQKIHASGLMFNLKLEK